MNKNKILIADDEVDIRELLGDFLGSEGYECILAGDAFEALEKFKADPDIDLVMSDIRMPGKTGLELLGEIKEIDNNAIVVMISAIKDIASAISAMSKGAYDYVTKPFKLTEVSQIARKAIEKRRLILEVQEYQRNLERMVAERTAELHKANTKLNETNIQLNNALKELDETYNFTLRALVTALDMRDAEIQGHSWRVVKYTMEIAGILGIKDKKELKVLEYGALLHDIGKIGISDAILNKKGQLSPEEWKEMKKHPVIGYRVLNKIKFLEDASQVVLHHHEHYDGTGYPTRLVGDEIPLGSRIFSVADMLDAITSERPYRKAMSFEIASRELKRNSGKQFDPDVVKAFYSVKLSYWKDIKKVTDRDSDSWEIPDLEF
ncbi:MAG: response regulator [Candidatus Aminicenantes bacterium]|nr:response regulator [Candidatus Aminicenantes bacterium]